MASQQAVPPETTDRRTVAKADDQSRSPTSAFASTLRRDKTAGDVGAALTAMHDAELIAWDRDACVVCQNTSRSTLCLLGVLVRPETWIVAGPPVSSLVSIDTVFRVIEESHLIENAGPLHTPLYLIGWPLK